MITTRRIDANNWHLWRELRLAALAEAPRAFSSTFADWKEASEERWKSRFSNANLSSFLAFYNGKPAGMAAGFHDSEAGVTELLSMWVDPKYRGQGVGDGLIEAVAELALRNGATRLKLVVMNGNEAATKMYLRNGFVDINEVEVLTEVQKHVMVKNLQNACKEGDGADIRVRGMLEPEPSPVIQMAAVDKNRTKMLG